MRKLRTHAIALIMTLLLLVVLVVIVGQLSYSTKIEVYLARNAAHDLENQYALISAVNYAIAYLRLDAMQERGAEDKFDALSDVWGQPKKLTIGDTVVAYTITAEDSKFNLLHLLEKEFKTKDEGEKKENDEQKKKDNEQKKEDEGGEGTPKPTIITPAGQFDRLIELLQAEQNVIKIESRALRESIIAWMKEKKGQESLEGPFQKKIPIYSVKELLLAKDVTPLLLYGPGGELAEKFPCLKNYVTVWSDGKINVNTADARVIQSLSDKIDAEMAKKILERRERGDDKGKKAFATLKEFQDFLVSIGAEENAVYPAIESLITLRSHYFTIEAMAQTGRIAKKITVVVYRNDTRVYKLYCDFHE